MTSQHPTHDELALARKQHPTIDFSEHDEVRHYTTGFLINTWVQVDTEEPENDPD